MCINYHLEERIQTYPDKQRKKKEAIKKWTKHLIIIYGFTMIEKKELKSMLSISKKGYKEHKIALSSFGIDKKREKEFNQGKKIEVTKDELLALGEHRWLT